MTQRWWEEASSPLSEVSEMISGVLEELLGPTPFGATGYPRVEVRRADDGLRVVAAVPGVAREDLDVSLEGDRLVLAGERAEPTVPEGAEGVRRERPTGPFRRTVPIPEWVEPDEATARLRNGLLTIELPRRETRPSHEITIEMEEDG